MKTTIYNKVMRMVLLSAIGFIMPASVMAQEKLHLFYKSGVHTTCEITNDTKMEFVKQPYMMEVGYSFQGDGDTIHLSANAGRSYSYGIVQSNVPWNASVDADWLVVRQDKLPAYLIPVGDGMHESAYLLFASANETSEYRMAKLSINTSHEITKEFVVVQYPYILSLEPPHMTNFTEAVNTKSETIAWDDTLYWASVYPNHGVKVLSYPDWMNLDIQKDGACTLEDVKNVPDSVRVTQENIGEMSTSVRFLFDENESSDNRTGTIVFESHGQTAVLTITQEGLNEGVLSSLEDMQHWMVRYGINSTSHDDFSHMSVLHAADMMTEDITIFKDDTDGWFYFDYEFDNNAANYRRPRINWETYYGVVARANATIDLVDEVKDKVSNENFLLGNAYAYRAMAYLYLIQLFQNPTSEYGVNKTLPGVPMLYARTEKNEMSPERVEYFKGRNTVAEVFTQIESDITRAIELLEGEVRPTKNYIDVTVAQGIAARYYLLAQDWQKAATMANAARSGYRLMDGNTETNGIRDGFLDITNEEWMWGFDHNAETQTTYASFFSHISNLSGGYSGLGISGRGIDARLFDQMSDTDYRRAYWYRDGNGNTQSTNVAASGTITWQYPYAILKYGWAEGWTQDYLYMRAAEMVLIEAEARMQLGEADSAKSVYAELMTRRDPNWQPNVLSLEDIYLQRRLELIGEGHAYFDLKRLNRGVERNYEGSNHLLGFKKDVQADDSVWVYKIPQSAIDNDSVYNLTFEDNIIAPIAYLKENSSSYNNDTIFMSASAGRTIRYGWIECNYPWTISTDADWLLARINESDKYDSYFTSGAEYENLFMVYAAANETEHERVGHVTLSTMQNVTKTYTVVQRPYTLSFNEPSYANNSRYDGEPVDTFVVEGAWDWNMVYFNLVPNHGWEVTDYPDWLTLDEFVHGAEYCSFDSIRTAEDILKAGQPIVSSVSFTFEPNESLESRTAYITFEGHGQKVVGVFNQEGLNEQSIVNAAQTLVKRLYLNNAANLNTHDDFGFPSLMIAMDSRGSDMVALNHGYNWFSPSLTYSDLNSHYRATALYWTTMYNHIRMANEVVRAYCDYSDQSLFQFYLAQAYAIRAFNYFYLAQIYQHTYVGNEDALCVPLIHERNMDVASQEGCPRATVREVYEFILQDLNLALQMLQQTEVVSPGKHFVSSEVVYGLRARVNMVRGEWKAVVDDAKQIIDSQVAIPYTRDEVSSPTFADINHAAWLWGIDVEETETVVVVGVCNWPSHMGSFNYGYASLGVWRKISESLYDSIPVTDVRKGWFLNENITSPHLDESELGYLVSCGAPAYTQVKFAPYNNEVGTDVNSQDIPLMRIEEIYLILAEAQAMIGSVDDAVETLNSFVTNYRDPGYNCEATTSAEVREAIWMQRRIELWGEGHAYFDLMRMKKGVDRRGAGFEDAYVYNIPAGDAALIYPIPQREMNANINLIQNPQAEFPQPVGSVTPEETSSQLYMIGQDFGQWDWASDAIVTMTPVHSHDGAYWTTRYMKAESGFKFCTKREWNGDFFKLGDSDYGYIAKNGNCHVEEDGFYTIYVDLTKQFIAVEPAAVYGIGECFGGWDVAVEENRFVAVDGKLVSPVTVEAGELRMYVAAPSIIDAMDWWKMEFNVYDGAIVYRGNEGDQARFSIPTNQVITLDLNAGTGSIVDAQ